MLKNLPARHMENAELNGPPVMAVVISANVELSGRAMSDATVLLTAVEKGDPTAAEQLLNLLYGELPRLATSKMAREVPGQTLQPTNLVHEAWFRLVGAKSPKFENRAHFFSAAAEAMRR